MARELLIHKTGSSRQSVLTYRRSRSTSSSKSQRQYTVADSDFRTYRKFSVDAGGHSGGRDDGEGIVMSLIRRCRSRSASRSSRRRRLTDEDIDDDDNDDVTEHIELCQLSGLPVVRLTDVTDSGHKFVTDYVDVPVWCDRCGQLIIGVYGHYVVCQCKYQCVCLLTCYGTLQIVVYYYYYYYYTVPGMFTRPVSMRSRPDSPRGKPRSIEFLDRGWLSCGLAVTL